MHEHYELRCSDGPGPDLYFSEGLGIVTRASTIRYANLRSANFALRRAEKEPDLIPAGGRLAVYRVTEEELERDDEPRAKLGPVEPALEEVEA